MLECMEFKVETPMVVYEDNQATKNIAENPEASKRTKHIDVRFHHVREQVEAGNIKIYFVSSKDQKADGMTKNLGKIEYKRFRDLVVKDVRYCF